jgi:hypothetical protein
MFKTKDNSELIVDTNRPKIFSIALQSFKSVTGRIFHFLNGLNCIQKQKLSVSFGVQLNRQSPSGTFGIFGLKNILGTLICPAGNHFCLRLYQYMIQRYRTIEIKYNHRSAYFLTFLCMFPACVSRAPTDCELDKRSGLYPSSFCEGKPENGSVEPVQGDAPATVKLNEIPVRSEPLVKRVWIHDQILEGGHWMQGTWAYIEVEPSKWLGTTTRPMNPSKSADNKPASINVPLDEKPNSKASQSQKSSPRLGGRQ